jgi:O-antigen/teichoic acid export membrane protein
MMGGGLAELGVVVLLASVFTETTRVVMARRFYSGPIIERASLDRKMMARMFAYGMKNNISGLPYIVIVQTTSVVLAASAGPAALAVLARPLALVSLISRLVRQYAQLLTPVAGGMQGLKRQDDMKGFFLSSLRNSVAMTIPPLMMLAAYGDIVIEIWMTKEYVVPWLCPVMSLAFLPSMSQVAAMRILAGVDGHGRVAVWSLIVSMLVYAPALAIAIANDLDVMSAAIVVGLALTAGPGMVVMIGACKRFEVGLLEYFMHAILPPMLCNLVSAAVLITSRILYPDLTFVGAVLWGIVGGVTVMACYWRLLLTDDKRSNLAMRATKIIRR